MKGIIFNLLEHAVIKAHGPKTWKALVTQTGLARPYAAAGNYPDSEMIQFVGAAAHLLNTSVADVLRWFGREAISHLSTRYSHFFAPHKSTSTFMLTINDAIHADVRKIYPDADLPTFDFLESTPNRVVLAYRSARRLCALAEGFIAGAASHFGEDATIVHPTCMLRGDDRCVLECTFEPRRGGERGA
ncbi:MAG: heme NO-binding domain-containing protein [Deltaproteobacteria bacterium]|nr:heme NO-binding domain-containing protein [Deltaproteobacteria bacterium]